MSNVVNVVAALIIKDNKVLIAKRSTGDSEVYGKWEFPGGKVEFGESEKQAIEREIKEEFELVIKAEKFLAHHVCEYPTKIVDLKLYKCHYLAGEFNLHDHFEYKYVDFDDLLKYDLAPADIPLAKYVKELKR